MLTEALRDHQHSPSDIGQPGCCYWATLCSADVRANEHSVLRCGKGRRPMRVAERPDVLGADGRCLVELTSFVMDRDSIESAEGCFAKLYCLTASLADARSPHGSSPSTLSRRHQSGSPNMRHHHSSKSVADPACLMTSR